MKLIRTAIQAATMAVYILLSSALPAQEKAVQEKTVRIDFSNPALIPANWTLELHPDGSGHFCSSRGGAPRLGNAWLEPQDQDRPVQVSSEFAAHVFEVAASEHYFQKQCESRDKVAFQGSKHLVYEGPDGRGECTFNYSRIRGIQQLGDSLLSVASTILEGARIERLRQHDRLGLDKEMELLSEMLSDGRAAEIAVIRPTLESLATDEALMERVRKRAREMLKAGNRD